MHHVEGSGTKDKEDHGNPNIPQMLGKIGFKSIWVQCCLSVQWPLRVMAGFILTGSLHIKSNSRRMEIYGNSIRKTVWIK